MGLVFLVLVLTQLSACVGSSERLWPPPLSEPARTIYVSVDTWHAVIGFQKEKSESSVLNPQSSQYEEWGYAEREWYVEGRQGPSGVLRALFWPSAGVVEVGRYDRLWASRTPQPPAELFMFRLSDEGWTRLRGHLQTTIATREAIRVVNQSIFYSSSRSYHVFHQCHHYVAWALQEAGLPISPHLAFSRGSLVWQLKRAVRLASEERVAAQIQAMP
jgi:hypothetical protein